MASELLQLGKRITLLPVIHGSGDCALEVRRRMLDGRFDCLAVPLPPSFQEDVETAIGVLPVPMAVVQLDRPDLPWQRSADPLPRASYVPIDPCQPVIMALRIALGEHMPRHFIDRETAIYRPHSAVLPDPYALKRVSIERFAAALLPALPDPPTGQVRQRITHLACRLRGLEQQYRSILLVCSVLEWPWIRHEYQSPTAPPPDEQPVEPTRIYQPSPRTLLFMLGELPFITGLYERARAELDDDENLSIDGLKELLITARQSYQREFGRRARAISPQMLSTCLKYVRNLTLITSRLSPDLYRIVTAAKQVIGESYALHVAELAGKYPYVSDTGYPTVKMGIGRLALDDDRVVPADSRLPGPPLQWRSIQLARRPDRQQRRRWRMQWNPLMQCSWPPEDDRIESFRWRVVERAKSIMGADLIRTEKFTTSVKDGIDIRDTLRSWHTGDIYVKVLPPTRGFLDAVVMLFDSPADPRDYPWRTTWFAEHANESTLALFATDFRREPIGPGIFQASYGGALFLFPPLSIPDVWHDPRLDFTATLEERILAAACLHAQSPHIALLSSAAPGAGWRRLARRFKKKWVHVPMAQFSQATIHHLRQVHVLGGKHVRSYASHFIRYG
jgi:hypothetical protein